MGTSRIRHSGESRNPGKTTNWTPACAGVTKMILNQKETSANL